MSDSFGYGTVLASAAALGTAGYFYLNSRPGLPTPDNYSYVVPNSADVAKGLGEIHRHPNSKTKLKDRTSSGERTLWESWQHGLKEAGDGPCLGYRPIVNGKAQPFEWESYKRVDERARNFGSGLLNFNLIPTIQGTAETGPMRLLAIMAKNRKEWVIAEQGLFGQSGTTVPLYDTLGADVIEMVVNETELTSILCGRNEFKAVIGAAPKCPTLKNIILIEEVEEAEVQQSEAAGVKLWTFAQVERSGAESPQPINPPKPEQIATFCYTSGTTGKSKGTLLTHGAFVSDMSSVEDLLTLNTTDVHLSYLPLAHGFERIVQAAIFWAGGCVGFYQGDTLKILDDLIGLRPTLFPSVPRLLNRIYDKIDGAARAAGGAKSALYERGLATKLAGLKQGWRTHKFWDKLVFSKIAQKVGLDRARYMITGSAPIAPHVLDWLRAVFGIQIMEGYGQTEVCAGSNVTHPNDLTTGHVGGPLEACEIRLVDVAEMGYRCTDQQHGEGANAIPCRGRGEVCFRGPMTFKGYYKMPEVTAETLDEEGWVHSGDIGVWTVKGQLKIVDRKKNIFKLAQGEYVAPEKIENIYLKSPYVAQAFVYGDSFQPVLVGVMVPDPDHVLPWAKAKGLPATPKDLPELCKNQELVKLILDDLVRVGKEAKLTGFEQVKALYLEPKAWTPEDILTPTFKLKRADGKKKYQAEIDELYHKVGDVAGRKDVKQQ